MLRLLLIASVAVLSTEAFLPSPLSLAGYNHGSLAARTALVSLRAPVLFAKADGSDEKPKKVPSMEQTIMQGPMTTGSHGPLSVDELDAAREELKKYVEKGFRIPVRSHMDDEDTKWRFGAPPVYDLANLQYFKGKTKNHEEGSLEQIVEDLIKTWEMEASHKTDVKQWQTITPEWTMQANGRKQYNREENIVAGNYNVLMDGIDKEIWDTSMTWDETHDVMHDCFPAFPFEVLEVFSPPPIVSFSWRHWAEFTGSYKGNKGEGQLVEMFGFIRAEVSEDLKLKQVEVYYKPEEFFKVLQGDMDAEEIAGGKQLVGPGCPFSKVMGLTK